MSHGLCKSCGGTEHIRYLTIMSRLTKARTVTLLSVFTVVLSAFFGCSRGNVVVRDASGGSALTSVTAVTYNIRHGRGNDERLDLERTANVLRSLNADIIGLQEVDSSVRRSSSISEADSLGTLLSMHSAFGAFFDYQGGRYGMGMLSRNPIFNVSPLKLPEGNEPRIALFAYTTTNAQDTIAVVVVHFDWVTNDSFRFRQASVLAETLDTMKTPYVLLGDFNDVPASRTLALFRSRATEASKPEGATYTFPSTNPRTEIDYIFTAPAERWNAVNVEVVNEQMASDHRPVRALLQLQRR